MAADVRSIRLAGGRHLAKARECLAPVVVEWARRWCLGGTDCRADTVAAGWPLAGEAAGLQAMATATEGDAWLMASPTAWSQVIFGAAQGCLPADAVADEISGQARDALLLAIFPALGLVGRLADVPRLPTRVGGQVHLEVVVNGAPLWLCLDAALLTPSSQAPVPIPLASREEAAGSARVALHIELSLLRVGVDELLGLQVGDIIRGDKGLEATFAVRVGQRVLPLQAALGERDGRKAIRLDN